MLVENILERNIVQKCDVCGHVVLVDQFGNGECQNCGWNQSVVNRNNPTIVTYPNMVSLEKAKKLNLLGEPLLPSFEDFVEALLMYSEMHFEYADKHFGVCCYQNGVVELFQNGNVESVVCFNGIGDFVDKAHIDGKLLKDIWKHVKNATYMQ